ncbi:hypothetical protein Rhopal_006017-T1 [Rhodotorula paludigena]|uniref:Mediator complex subunit 1 n=1 Tax=Rhodotorula paludigena TaxID=86838 RepID=A0AAV5GTZ2_9BASI|nr:hypothetical protein Rhopal_006017-T1 [Rhodotorula paludigena]
MPDSVLATAHSLRTLVAESFPSPTATATPAPHPHPLSASPAPSSLPALRAALSSHLSSLRSSLATFSTLALPPSASAQDPTASATGKRETDKYLTLLRDSAQHQAALLAHRTAATAHLATHRDNDDAWPVRVPFTRSRGAVLEALEGVAKELALVAFRDGDGGEGGAEGTAAEQSTKPVTLSVGGKVMVVDFEVRGGAADASAGEGGATVERVKVAYVVDGTDRVCDPAAQKLHALLSGPCDNEQERWKGVRRVLRQLGELDAETERSGRDCFTLLTESLVEELGGALGGAQSAAGAEEGQGPDLPALLPPSPTSLHPTLHLYSTPLASLLSPSPSSSPASTKPPGVYTATISLDLSAPPGAGEAEDRDAPRFVAVLDPPVPLSRATGREICEALGLRGSRDLVRDEGEEEQEGEEADEGWWSAVCGHERARGGRAEGDFAGGGVDEKCYRLRSSSLRLGCCAGR